MDSDATSSIRTAVKSMSRKNGQRFTATTGAPYNREKQVKKVDY
jgi:hypothetical protein